MTRQIPSAVPTSGSHVRRARQIGRQQRLAQDKAIAAEASFDQRGWSVSFDLATTGKLRRLEPYEQFIGERADELTVRREAEAVEAQLSVAYSAYRRMHAQATKRSRSGDARAVPCWQVTRPRELADLHARAAPAPLRAARPRGTGGRPARRAAASSSTSSCDPGDPDLEPPPPRPAPASRARAILTYAALPAAERGADVEQVTS